MESYRRYHRTIVDALNIFLESCDHETLSQDDETLLPSRFLVQRSLWRKICSTERVVRHLSHSGRHVLNISQRIACPLILSRSVWTEKRLQWSGYNFCFFFADVKESWKSFCVMQVLEKREIHLKYALLLYQILYLYLHVI